MWGGICINLLIQKDAFVIYEYIVKKLFLLNSRDIFVITLYSILHSIDIFGIYTVLCTLLYYFIKIPCKTVLGNKILHAHRLHRRVMT